MASICRYFSKPKHLCYSLATSLLCTTPFLYGDAATYQKSEYPAEPDLFRKDDSIYFITSEYLCWNASEGALDYALHMNHPAWSTIKDTYAIGDYRNAEFDWSSGLRFAFGFFRAPHYWDIFLQYTYVPCFGSNESHAPDSADRFLNGTWIHPDVDTTSASIPLKKANTRIQLDYHLLELLMSRRFYTNPHFRLNLYGGVASAFLYQDWDVFYTDLADQQSKISNDWSFEGLGLRLGVKLDWYLGWDLYLTGLASSGILAGWYENTAKQSTDAFIPTTDKEIPFRDTKFEDTRLTYTTQFMSGISWQKVLEPVRLECLVGYEFNIWTNLHQVYRSGFAGATAGKDTYINDSNLSLQGATVRFNIDF